MKSVDTEILFISDLHLSTARPAMIGLFTKFVESRAVHANALYILGDFFEYWLGDDDPADEFSSVFDAFTLLHNKNIPVYFMHGNRDFLIGENFEKRTHCKIISDPSLITINNNHVTLMHGDSLCTDDLEYQQFKNMIRSTDWKAEFLSKPMQERQALVQKLRETSKSETAQKQESIMDVNQQAVLETFKAFDTEWLIHGHTHRVNIHHYPASQLSELNNADKKLTNNDQQLTRIVLGDWHQKGSVLSITYPSDEETTSGFNVKLEDFE